MWDLSFLPDKFFDPFSPQLFLALVGLCATLPLVAQDSTYTETANGVTFKMVRVQGGSFEMGCTAEQGGDCVPRESPARRVGVSDYSIGETEVTQALWRAVMGENPSYFKDCDECPVESVDWNDAQEFIRRLNVLTGKGYRLPTEAEWEYAARGGNKSGGYKYSGSDVVDEVAWHSLNSGLRTHETNGKKANELGLYDMSGNVFEWCSDWKAAYSPERQTNPTGPATGTDRTFRGGGWLSVPQGCRVSFRGEGIPGFRDAMGLRLASR